MPKRIPEETKQRAVRLVLDHLDEYPNLTAAGETVSKRLGFGSESLRRWVRQAQVDQGDRAGVSSIENEELKALRREVRELREANAILRDAGGFLRRGTRPPTALIVAFIDEQRIKHRAVESVCQDLREQGVQVAARTYRAWKRAEPSARVRADAVVIDALLATVGTPEGLYGRRKMTAHLRRGGLVVSKRQIDRLMRDLGLNGLVRGRRVRTTVPDRHADRAPDLLDRDFTAQAPNRRWVADFTYVRTWAGFAYVSFVIDCFSRAIVGWHAATVKTTPLVTTALRMGLWRRDRAGHPAVDGLIHHSDAGSQFTSVSFAETLTLEGIAASIGSIGDAYDNALAESTIGLFKNEAIREGSPFRSGPLKTIDDVEWATAGWVDWYNARRLHSTLGNVPPDEYEAVYYADLETPSHPVMAPA
ncbi:IS3 family transposase [Microbacterium caowuchunii]|uniref:IS3 family transposase n=1 Tax=Microbacterium caowuchunii TaxID=2614638 RepID=UPI0012456211|nr:IS3 family transposase [Microbacterium caowuchunii]QEW00622.1 IS3 family transposase [Microbacterium caowuchunii]